MRLGKHEDAMHLEQPPEISHLVVFFVSFVTVVSVRVVAAAFVTIATITNQKEPSSVPKSHCYMRGARRAASLNLGKSSTRHPRSLASEMC